MNIRDFSENKIGKPFRYYLHPLATKEILTKKIYIFKNKDFYYLSDDIEKNQKYVYNTDKKWSYMTTCYVNQNFKKNQILLHVWFDKENIKSHITEKNIKPTILGEWILDFSFCSV